MINNTMSNKEQPSSNIVTTQGTFVKIDEDCKRHPCLECKMQCSGYWFVLTNGFKRPYPFCTMCVQKGLKS